LLAYAALVRQLLSFHRPAKTIAVEISRIPYQFRSLNDDMRPDKSEIGIEKAESESAKS
jgi:hypothetical protein